MWRCISGKVKLSRLHWNLIPSNQNHILIMTLIMTLQIRKRYPTIPRK